MSKHLTHNPPSQDGEYSSLFLVGGPFVILVFGALFLLGCAQSKQHPFSKRDIQGAQRVLGLNFTEDEIDSLGNWLKRNHSGIAAMRKYSLPNEIVPRIYFSPLPQNFSLPTDPQKIEWPTLDQVSLPEDPNELAFSTVAELAELIRSGRISSVELTQLYIRRIRRYDDTLKAVITLTEELAPGTGPACR